MAGRVRSLDPSEVTDILGMLVEGFTQSYIESQFTVSLSTIKGISAGKLYDDVTKGHPLMLVLDERRSKRGKVTSTLFGYDPLYATWQNRRFRGSDG